MNEWMDRAACRDHDPETWFAQGFGTLAAVRVCADCPVTADCLEYQMRWEETHTWTRFGVFGGLTPNQRRRLARAARR